MCYERRRSTYTTVNGRTSTHSVQFKSDEVYVNSQQVLWKLDDSTDDAFPKRGHTYTHSRLFWGPPAHPHPLSKWKHNLLDGCSYNALKCP